MATGLDQLSSYYEDKGNQPRANLYAALAAEERDIKGPETLVPVQPITALSPESSAPTPPTPNFYIVRPREGLVLPSTDQLVTTARAELKAAFGRDIEVPAPPTILFERLQGLAEREITGFETYYLPQMQMRKGDKFWKGRGKVQPEDYFWDQIKAGNYPAEVATTEEGWYIGDERGKPPYKEGQQTYANDYLAAIMAHLRDLGPDNGGIERYDPVPTNSRFGASPTEIEEVILPMFAETSGAKGIVQNMRHIGFNVRGNMAHPEWGQTNTWQLFGDPVFQGTGRLIGGSSDVGGLAHVLARRVGLRSGHAGFSPVERFLSTPR